MKVQNLIFLVIGLALGGGGVYLLKKQSNSEDTSQNKLSPQEVDVLIEELEDFNAVVDLGASLIKEMQQKNIKFDSAAGDFLTQSEAGPRWRSFRDWNTKRWNFRKEIKPNGFAFGLQKLRIMIKEIDKINEDLYKRNVLDSIILGVRINLSHTTKENKKHIDALIVPIIKEGKNFIDLKTKSPVINTFDDSSLLLNTSVPCPSVCDPI